MLLYQTATPGASATFRFSGSSVALHGVFSWQDLGLLSVKYIIDGSPITQTYSVTPTAPEFKAGVKQLPNFLFFSNDSLTPGNHTITMEVVSAVGQPFSLDYILYSPSFATLAAKPNFTQAQTTSVSNSVTPSTAPTINPASARNSSPPVSAIIGGVVGGITVLLLLIALAFLWRKKRFNSNSASLPFFEPFTLSSPSAATSGKRLLSPWTMSQHKYSIFGPTSFSTISPSMFTSRVAARNMSTTQLDNEIDTGVGIWDRMQRLEELTSELSREIAAGGENAPRAAELRGQISELTRHNTEVSGRGRRQDIEIESVAPPAYEPEED